MEGKFPAFPQAEVKSIKKGRKKHPRNKHPPLLSLSPSQAERYSLSLSAYFQTTTAKVATTK